MPLRVLKNWQLHSCEIWGSDSGVAENESTTILWKVGELLAQRHGVTSQKTEISNYIVGHECSLLYWARISVPVFAEAVIAPYSELIESSPHSYSISQTTTSKLSFHVNVTFPSGTCLQNFGKNALSISHIPHALKVCNSDSTGVPLLWTMNRKTMNCISGIITIIPI
jgi:hypothetical protein